MKPKSGLHGFPSPKTGKTGKFGPRTADNPPASPIDASRIIGSSDGTNDADYFMAIARATLECNRCKLRQSRTNPFTTACSNGRSHDWRLLGMLDIGIARDGMRYDEQSLCSIPFSRSYYRGIVLMRDGSYVHIERAGTSAIYHDWQVY